MNNANVQKELNAMRQANVNTFYANQAKMDGIEQVREQAKTCIQKMNALEQFYYNAKTKPNEVTKKLFMRSYEHMKAMVEGMSCDARYDRVLEQFNDMVSVGYLWSDEDKERFQLEVINPMMDARDNWDKYTTLYEQLQKEQNYNTMAKQNRAAKIYANVSGEVPSWDPIYSAPKAPATPVTGGCDQCGGKSWVKYQGQKRKVYKVDGKKWIQIHGKKVALGTIRGQYEYVKPTSSSMKGGCGCMRKSA